MYSALKHQGKRLYELARKGEEVEREPRPITIRRDRAARGEPASELVFEVRCSKGTYVRTLAEDIGAALGCGGPYDRPAPHRGRRPFDAERCDLDMALQALARQGGGWLRSTRCCCR